ncbi:MAG TPA: GNAT family protein [Rudaea sp.]|nr:GNAT family protein [Rudaea sp.]
MSEPIPDSIELGGDGLLLRPYRAEDSRALAAAVRESAESVGAWLPWCHVDYGDAEADAWIMHCAEGWRSGEHFAFAAFDAKTAQFLGAAGLNQRNREHNFMNLGYWVRTSRQGNGIAVRAARLVAAFGFGQIGLTRIEIVAALNNRASRRVAEKSGALFEAVARNRLVDRGNPIDAAVYALVPAPL